MSNRSIGDVLAGCASVLGIGLLCFLGGATVVEFEVPPYPQLLEPSYRALEAQLEKETKSQSPEDSIRWQEVDHGHRGVTVHRPDEAFQGYTVYLSADAHEAYMIDMEGNRVYEWGMPFREAFPNHPHVADPVEDEAIHWTSARVFPDGDVLAIFTADGDTPYGYGLVKLDENSELIWTYADHVHHDFTVTDDGTIWTLVHDYIDLSESPMDRMPEKFRGEKILADYAVKLSSEGEELKRISLTKSVLESEIAEHLDDWHRGKKWDLLHANNVEPLPADFARHHDFADPGDLLLSFREINAIALVDPETRELVWQRGGFWVKQHDPDPLGNGNMLIFDNRGARGPGGRSRVAEFAPQSGEIVWSYAGSRNNPFATQWGGKQTKLPNGNVLITENLGARLLEVNRDREIVWEFYNPRRASVDGEDYIALIAGGHQRIPESAVDFLD